MKRTTLLCLLLLAAPLPAVAQQEEPVLVIAVENVTAAAEADAGTPRTSADARPADVLRYRLTFTNRSDGPLRNVVLSNPIPSDIRLVGGSARASRDDALVEYSADGGSTWAAEPMEEVVVEGRREMRPIPPERFTDVRWTIQGPVQPRGVVTAEYDTRFRLAESTL